MAFRITMTMTRPSSEVEFYSDDSTQVPVQNLLNSEESAGRITSVTSSTEGLTKTVQVTYDSVASSEIVAESSEYQAFKTAFDTYNSANGITATITEEDI